MNNNVENKENDSKKIFTMIVLIIIFMMCTTSATYAYYALSASSDDVINGTAAVADLYWGSDNSSGAPTLLLPKDSDDVSYSSKPLVPQLSINGSNNVLQSALSAGCVDGNGNAICRVYTFNICNNSTATATIAGTIEFTYGSSSSFTNLKYLFMDSATSTGTVSSTTIMSASDTTETAQTFVSSLTLSSGYNSSSPKSCTLSDGTTSKTFYLIVWIEETGSSQNDDDKGTFYVTINFTSSGGGITSTITS